MRSEWQRLEDVLEAIERIEKYVTKGQKEFERDELVQTWVVHHLQIIGEACGKLSSKLQKEYPKIPWAEIVAMRNILVHDYFGIDVEEVWTTVEQDLPVFKRQIKGIIKKLEDSSP